MKLIAIFEHILHNLIAWQNIYVISGWNLATILSLTYDQFCAPRYRVMVQYAFYGTGYIKDRPVGQFDFFLVRKVPLHIKANIRTQKRTEFTTESQKLNILF